MKKLVISTLAALAVAASASAAYISAGVGYLVDAEEAILTVRGGIPFNVTQTEKLGALAHNAELEVGYLEQSEIGVKVETLPVYLNYRAEFKKEGWAPYAGAGLGFARVRGTASGYFGTASATDTSFTFQVFLGTHYNFTESSALQLGARYVWLDEVDFGYGLIAPSSDDLVLEVGYSFRF